MVKVKTTIETPEFEVLEKVELDARETAVLVIDMQNDFAHPKGRLYSEASRAIIPAIRSILDKAREVGTPIVYTQDWHVKNDPEFRLWGEHCLEGSWGAEIVDELKPKEGDIIVRKRRYDAFFHTDLDYILRHVLKVKTLVITGTLANICVLHTIGSAVMNWYNVVVPIDAVASLTEFDLYILMRQVSFVYRGILTKSEGIVFRRG